MKESPLSHRSNTDELEQYIREVEEKEKQKWKETLGLFLLTLISLGGLVWILVFSQELRQPQVDIPLTKERVIPSSNGFHIKEKPKEPVARDSSQTLQNEAIPKPQREKTGQPSIPNLPDWTLEISGVYEPYQKIVFSLSPFDPDFSYRIAFGDGRTKNMIDSEIRYAYARVGEYRVTVRVYYRGEAVETVSRILFIQDE